MNARLKFGLMSLWMMGYSMSSLAQSTDSVVIRVGNESKVIFMIKDKQDLETLKHYNFQALMDDMLLKLEKRDSTTLTKPSYEYLKDSVNRLTPLNTSENWQTASDRDEEDDNRRER